ncbi:MAG: RHS repeat domain-containing protein [Rhizobiaceae bacterium]
MKRGHLRAILSVLGFLAAAAGAQQAFAQSTSFLNAPSPEKIAVTPGGVDIRTGRLSYNKTDLSIGEGGGSLSLARIMTTAIQGHAAPFGNLSHNWDITLVIKPVSLDQYPGQYDYVANVNYGARSQTFEKLYLNDPAFRQKSQNEFTRLTTPGTAGALGAVYTYRATDGTIAVFRPMANGECTSAGYIWQCAFVSYVVEPDGTRFDFSYETTTASVVNKARLRSVTSSRGFALLFEYGGGGASWNQVSKACALNLGTVAKPANNICPGTAPSSATYSYTGLDARVVIASATTPDGAAEGFGYTSTIANQAFTMRFTKPGQSSPWMTNSMKYGLTAEGDLDPYVSGQSFADGSGYTYNYDLTPETGQPFGDATSFQTIAGGSYTNALGQNTQVRYSFPATPASMNPPRVPGSSGANSSVQFGDVVLQATGGPTRIVDPLGRETLSDYCDPNAMANLPPSEHNRCLVTMQQSQTDPEGNKTALKYGVNRNPIEIRHVAKAGSGLADIVEAATYDTAACISYLVTCDKPLTVTDAKGITTDYTWSATHGGMLTETRAAPTTGAVRPEKRYTYEQFNAWYKNAAGTVVQSPYAVWLVTQISECRTGAAPACIGTADETRTTFSYGSTGAANNLLPVSKTIAAGDGSISATTSWTYDALGNRLTEDGPLPGSADTTRWRYDARRRVIGVITPDPDGAATAYKFRAKRNTYDAAGRLIKVEQGTVNSQSDTDWAAFAPLQTTETAYDALDRKVREWTYGTSEGTQSLTQYGYDLAGRLECTAVRMNPATFGSPPTSACALGTEGGFGPDRITKLTYDAAGQLLKTTVAYGTALQTDQETNGYTANGKLASVTDGENNRTTFDYDGHDRLWKTRYPVPTVGALASSTTDYEQLSYDANGNITQRRLRDAQLIDYTYDNLNRMTFKNVPNVVNGEYDVTTTYDNLDRPTLVSDTASNNVGSTFDALGRLTAQTSPFGTIAMQYDAAGRLSRVTHPDGNYFGYTYNTVDLTDINENGSTSLVAYSYDDLGRDTGLTRGDGTSTTLTYDPVGRLRRFEQDLAGTSGDLTVNGPAAGGTGMSYNPASQLISQSRSNDLYAWAGHFNVDRTYGRNGLNQLTSAGATALGYDGRGNLTSSGSDAYTYTSENRLASGPGGALLWYDPTGRLSRVTKGTSTTKFEHLGPRLVIERDAAGAILRRYVHGPGDDEPVVWYEGATLTTKRWLHADERGSVIAVSDASGDSIGINRYDEYGIPAATNLGRFQFTGQAWLPELGLYYYKARMYSPTLGRFMQTDPVGYKDGINWYAYVGNDPINRADSTGKKSYLVVRPLDHPVAGSVASHAFIVTGAKEPGDRGAKVRVISFGELKDGTMGNVTDKERASETSRKAHATDVKAWRALAGKEEGAFAQIDAPDAVVDAVAGAMIENYDYDFLPGFDMFGGKPAANSNTAAFAIMERATKISGGEETGHPGGGITPGANNTNRIEFDSKKLCSSGAVKCR